MNAVQTHDRQTIPDIKDTLAVSSGKGGVGKSTLAANLAVALASRGLRIGLLDADIYGPNIPGMLGLDGRPEIAGDGGQIQPLASHGLKAISMGLLLDAGAKSGVANIEGITPIDAASQIGDEESVRLLSAAS